MCRFRPILATLFFLFLLLEMLFPPIYTWLPPSHPQGFNTNIPSSESLPQPQPRHSPPGPTSSSSQRLSGPNIFLFPCLSLVYSLFPCPLRIESPSRQGLCLVQHSSLHLPQGLAHRRNLIFVDCLPEGSNLWLDVRAEEL